MCAIRSRSPDHSIVVGGFCSSAGWFSPSSADWFSPRYSVEFGTLVTESGWNELALQIPFYQGLSNQVYNAHFGGFPVGPERVDQPRDRDRQLSAGAAMGARRPFIRILVSSVW